MADGAENGDVELSFDLTFSEGTPHRHEQDDSPRAASSSSAADDILPKAYSSSFQEPAQLPLSLLSTSAPQGDGPQKRRTRSRKRTATGKTKVPSEKDMTAERDKNCIFVFSTNGRKLNSSGILEHIEEQVGPAKQYYFRDKQCYGFVQFQKAEVAAKAAELLNGVDIHGAVLGVERCLRSFPGRDNKLPPDPLQTVKNTTLVIKNLPFNMKEERLRQILHAFEDQKLEDVAFHYDAAGTFRGMAFAKYRNIQDAVFVFEHINSIDVGGRSIRVEYKRKPDPGDEESQKIQQQLLLFKDNDNMSDLAFPYSLTNVQRKQIHMIAEKLGLLHRSYGENEHRYVIVSKKKDDKDGDAAQGSNHIGRKESGNQDGETSFGRSWSDKSSLASSFNDCNSPPGDRDVWRPRSFTGGSWKGSSSWSVTNSPAADTSMPMYLPVRQPTGPDGTNGFSLEYRQSRA